MKKYRIPHDVNAVPVIFCSRQKKWLPVEEHLECQYCAAPVLDEQDEVVSFLCTYEGEKKCFQSPPPPPPDEPPGEGD